MVLVFGLDIPLYEFLLMFMILLTAGLIFVLIELKRLNEYLIIERSDLKRLERDLGILESEEKKLAQEELKLSEEEVRLGLIPPRPRYASAKRKASSKRPAKKKAARKASNRKR